MLAALSAMLASCGSTPKTPPSNYIETIPGTTIRFEMIYVPGDGRSVKPFYLGKTEVTWDEFEAYYLTAETAADAVTRPSPPYEPPDHGLGRGRHPATSMRRQAAERYCEWLSLKTGKKYRLPTEAEWQFAASIGPFEPFDDYVWHAGNSGGKYQPVGTKKPNALGLHDLLGNVWEYCAGEEPVLRGGSWKDARADISPRARTPVLDEWSERDPQRPKSAWWLTDAPMVGFRVARSAH